MGPENVTLVSEFLLMGLSGDPELQPLLFSLFLSMCLVTVLGNLLIILAFISDSHLHTPMYFFLSSLLMTDIDCTSTTVPKMIVDIQTHSRLISYMSCLTQMSIFILFGCLDNLLLTAMSYDWFVAICYPLHYTVIMNPRLCSLLILVSFFISLLASLLHSLMVLELTFFLDMEISHFFCDPSQLLSLACFEIPSSNILIYFIGAIFGGFSFTGILFSYTLIVSSESRQQVGSIKPSPPVAVTWQSCVYFMILWNRPWGASQFYCLISQGQCSGLSDVHCGQPHTEPLCLQPEEQGHQEGHVGTPKQNNLTSTSVHLVCID